MSKHYITVDERRRITEGWSDGPQPEKDTSGAVCINEQGGYQFRLFPEGEENPLLYDEGYGVPLYAWQDGQVQERPAEDVEADQAVIAKRQAQEREKLDAMRARQEAVEEVQAALISAQINTLAVDDATALRWRVLYPGWAAGVEYKAGEKVQRADRLYRCLQGHRSQAGWEPETAASLWTEVCEAHAGTADDPIPYNGNMALESGKYYSQDGVTYRCTRDTGIPVYHPLAELVGLYVEVAEE